MWLLESREDILICTWAKVKGKRSKELRVLSRDFQGQPFSPCGVLCSHLSLPQVNSTTFPSPVVPNPSHTPPPGAVAAHPAAWSQHHWNASGNVGKPGHICLHHLGQNAGVVQGGLPVSKVHRRHEAREHWQKASCSVCRRKVWVRAGTNEIWRSKHRCMASRNLALISFSNAYWIIHVWLSSASLLMLLVIPLSLPSPVCFIILTLSKAQRELVSALRLGEKAVAKPSRQEWAGN